MQQPIISGNSIWSNNGWGAACCMRNAISGQQGGVACNNGDSSVPYWVDENWPNSWGLDTYGLRSTHVAHLCVPTVDNPPLGLRLA